MTLPATLTLTHRTATPADLDLLLQLRRECTWGTEKVQTHIDDPDWVFCLLLRGEEVVGMGGWVLELPGDEETASRERKTVFITSLFIRHKYQGTGIGSLALDLLEKAAVEEFGAEYLTLDTTRYHTYLGSDGQFVQDKSKDGKALGWYFTRGYKEYKEPKPKFNVPGPEPLTAAFLKKHRSLVRGI